MKIRIYDIDGELRYGRSTGDQRSEFIPEVYRNAKLRFMMDTRSSPCKLLCYVRAIESEGQGPEHFYVEATADSDTEDLLSEFRRKGTEKLRRVFHEVDLSSPTTDVFEYLNEEIDVSRYLTEREIQSAKSLAEEGRRLDFGAGDQRAAVAVAKEMTDIPVRVSIADSGRTQYYEDTEVVLDTGFDGEGIVPLGGTAEKIEKHSARQAKTSVKRKIAEIGEKTRELREIKQEEGLSESEVEEPLKDAMVNSFPELFRISRDTEGESSEESAETGKRVTATTAGGGGDGINWRQPGSKPMVVGAGIVAVAFLLIGGLVMVGAAGYIQDGAEGLLTGSGDNGEEDGADVQDDEEEDGDNGDEDSQESEEEEEERDEPPDVGFVDTEINGEDWGEANLSSDDDLSVTGALEAVEVEEGVEIELTGSLSEDDNVIQVNRSIEETGNYTHEFELEFSLEDVRDEMGYGVRNTSVNITAQFDDEVLDSEAAEVSWDAGDEPELELVEVGGEPELDSEVFEIEVMNVGDAEGEWNISINDDDVELDDESVTVGANETETISLDFQVAEHPTTLRQDVTVDCVPLVDRASCFEETPADE